MKDNVSCVSAEKRNIHVSVTAMVIVSLLLLLLSSACCWSFGEHSSHPHVISQSCTSVYVQCEEFLCVSNGQECNVNAVY